MNRSTGFNTPVFIICRDKVEQLGMLVSWLETSGYTRIILVDNDSTFPAMVEYLETSCHGVVRHDENMGPHRAIWGSDVLERFASGEQYVVTDSDIVPDPECPPDAVNYFSFLLERYPDYIKAGFALRIDNLPEAYALADEVRLWERRFWSRPLEADVYHAVIDTTFALYRANSKFEYSPSIRTGRPYWARHLPWYADSSNLTDEEMYYREHAIAGVAHWDLDGQAKWSEPPGMSARERLMWPLHSTLKVRRNRQVRWTKRGGL